MHALLPPNWQTYHDKPTSPLVGNEVLRQEA